MKKKKKIITGVLCACAGLGLITAALFSNATAPAKPQPLSQEELAQLVKPSVVRIAQHITGGYSIPEFSVNLQDLTLEFSQQSKSLQPVDEYITGSGFIVNPNGYMVTNAHVVSPEIIKVYAAAAALEQALQWEFMELSPEEQERFYSPDAILAEAGQRMLEKIIQNSIFRLESSIVVLNPNSSKENILDLFRTGFPAELLSMDQDFLWNEKDVALIKVNLVGLPSVPLGNSAAIETGNAVYVFGFPATAEFNQQNLLESTFTQGVISAMKFTERRDFQVFQTDAKISQGSSGGPMFNNRGEVVGLVTFQTGELQRRAGDNFAFAVPVSLAREILEKNGIESYQGEYGTHFARGLSYFKENRCKTALEEFALAKNNNPFFNADAQLNPYIKQCGSKIALGTSTDKNIHLLAVRLKTITPFSWFVVIGRLLLAASATAIIYWLLKKIRRTQRKIREIESELEEFKGERENHTIEGVGVPLPLPEDTLYIPNRQSHPHLHDYIREARAIGMKDHLIIEDLERVGWNRSDIDQALQAR